jgi:hypothetical protein
VEELAATEEEEEAAAAPQGASEKAAVLHRAASTASAPVRTATATPRDASHVVEGAAATAVAESVGKEAAAAAARASRSARAATGRRGMRLPVTVRSGSKAQVQFSEPRARRASSFLCLRV